MERAGKLSLPSGIYGLCDYGEGSSFFIHIIGSPLLVYSIDKLMAKADFWGEPFSIRLG